jgi:hypothetical protein
MAKFQMLVLCENLPSTRIGYRASAWCSSIANLTREQDAYPCRVIAKVTLRADSPDSLRDHLLFCLGDQILKRRQIRSPHVVVCTVSDKRSAGHDSGGFHALHQTKAHFLPLQDEQLAGSKTKGTSRDMSCSRLTTQQKRWRWKNRNPWRRRAIAPFQETPQA